MTDRWDRKDGFCCATCYVYAPKDADMGRCRRHAPTMAGYPVVYRDDWCGEHKLGSNPSKDAREVPRVMGLTPEMYGKLFGCGKKPVKPAEHFGKSPLERQPDTSADRDIDD